MKAGRRMHDRRDSRSRKKPENWVKIAKERIDILFSLAEREAGKHPERSKRYIQLARRIGMRYNVRLGPSLKRRFCPSCFAYLVPGKTSRVRTVRDRQAVVVKCLSCGKEKSYPYIREKKAARTARAAKKKS